MRVSTPGQPVLQTWSLAEAFEIAPTGRRRFILLGRLRVAEVSGAGTLFQEYGKLVAERLAQAELIITSDLTLIECDRVLIRAVVLNELHESDAAQRQARFNAVAARWTLLALDGEIIERARRPFPAEPIRALDAIHLASAVTARKAVSDLAVLTLDDRVRKAANRLGFPLVPTDAELGL